MITSLTPNGPAIKAGCVTRRRHRPEICHGASRLRGCHGARRVWRGFCRPGTKFFEFSECRGTQVLSGFITVTMQTFGRWAGAVSRHNLSRSQKVVMIYSTIYCQQLRASGWFCTCALSWKQDLKQKP